jgi:rare lipoprotein A
MIVFVMDKSSLGASLAKGTRRRDRHRVTSGASSMRTAAIVAITAGAMLAGCSAPAPPAPPPAAVPAAVVNPARFSTVGVASYYSRELNRKRTASGEPFNNNGLTAAHRSLPLNTIVRVTNLENGKSVLVRINDRGPYAAGRIIDLSAKAARTIGMTEEHGTTRVRIEVYDADQSASL